MIPICALSEIADGKSKGFELEGHSFFIVRQGEHIYAYLNQCPHMGIPLEWTPDEFLSIDGSHIQCCTHGAMFEINNGYCIYGPCYGDSLQSIHVTVQDGMIYLCTKAV